MKDHHHSSSSSDSSSFSSVSSGSSSTNAYLIFFSPCLSNGRHNRTRGALITNSEAPAPNWQETRWKNNAYSWHRKHVDSIQPTISTELPSAWPGTPFLKRALTRPFLPWNATIFPRTLCFPMDHATLRPIRWPASPPDSMLGKRRMHSLGFSALGPSDNLR